MFPLPKGALWSAFVLLWTLLFINGVNSEGRIVCYYTNWSVYRPGTAKFNPQNINPYLCTHLIYAFGGFTKDNQMKPFDKYQDIEQGGYAKFTGLKTYNKQLKTMIAIGGWNEASSRFSPLVANPERRQKFIKNILKFLRQNHFDGIDLDWEYPAHREGGKPGDRDNYAQFVQELRAEFERESEKTGRQRLLLTMAVPAGIEYIEKGYDIPKLNKYLDWFNVLTYDFHSSHEPSVNHHAPLYPLEEDSEYNYDAELNIDYSIKYYLKAGADRNKLVLGIPTYGRSYTLINEESTEIGAPAEGPGEQGDATREKGYLAFYEICNNIKEDPDWEVVQPNANAMGPYAYRRTQWVGYDDEAIVRKKAQYVVEHGLGGIMFWSIDNDDFRGTCTGKPYPLIEAAKESMFDAMGLGINEVSKSSAPRKSNRSRNHENSIATRNRINVGDKLTYEERKESSRRTSNQETRKRLQHSTTRSPSSTTIRLTEAEGSSLYIGGRTTTPPPPTTPDPGTDFKCEDEGFYQHPRDCKKYYWCLDSGPSGLGIVAHQFTCPSGLYFNPAADSCDFARNVPCKTKKSTTAAPVTKSYASTSIATTTKPTASVNRITAATARTTFFRTTSTTAHTTTTTTAKPPVDEEDYMDVEEQHSEEDPKVIKELIELIRRVGGIEELEKHLLRKDDGTISFKQHSSSSSNYAESTTSSSISKSLYDKVLSRPNALNSFRNRFIPSNSYRKTEQLDREKSDEESDIANENDTHNSKSTSEYSKYSSVVRGNSRQGPQNEGLDKLPEFSGFLKERKQYVTINRNRGSQKKVERVESDEEEIAATIRSEQITDKPFSAATPSYTSIRRTRPSTIASLIEEEDFKDTTIAKPHASLSRMHTTDASSEQADVNEDLALVKYKYLERARSNAEGSQTVKLIENKKNEGEDADITHQKEDQKITVQLSAAKADYSTQQLQEQVTTIPVTQRTYVSLGRRTTTTASNTETSTPVVLVTTTPTETSTAAPNNIENLTYQPLIALTTTIATTTTNLPATITNTSPSITIIPSITSDLLSSSKVLKQEYQLSQSTLPDSPTPDSTATTLTTEYNVPAIKHEIDSPAITVTTEKFSTPTFPGHTDNKDEVNLVIRDQNQSTVYNQIMRDTTPVITNTLTTTTEKYTSFTNRNNTDSLSSSNTAYKYFGGKREKDQQKVLSRSSLKQTTELYPLTTTITNESINNEFLGSVSSPRPFGYPKRRGRPTVSSTTTVATEVTSVKTQTKERPSFVQKAKLNAAVTPPTKKYHFNRSRFLTPTITTGVTTTSTTTTEKYATKESQDSAHVASVKDHDNYLGLTTTQPPSTTLLHVFTLSDDEQSTRPSNSGADAIPRLIFERVRPKHKVIEINRVVEIHSKEEKLRRKSKANQIVPIGGPSPLKVESLPHVEQLGEISVVKYVHLVDGSDIKVEGHSTVTDYTPTESIIQKSSMPVRNSLPEDREPIDDILNQNDQYSPETSVIIRVSTSQESPPNVIQKRQGKALVPEVIREAVETSTISLEGLFENARKAKVSNTIDGTQTHIHINSQNNDAKIAVGSISTDYPEASDDKNINTSSNVPLIAWLNGSNGERQEIAILKNSPIPLKNNDTEQKSTLSSQFIQEDATTIGPNLGNFKMRTPTTAALSGSIASRRPVLSVRRRLINSSSTTIIPTHIHTTTGIETSDDVPAITAPSSSVRDELTTTLSMTTPKYNRLRFNKPQDLSLASSYLAAASVDNINQNVKKLSSSTTFSSPLALRRKYQTRRLTTISTTISNNDDSATEPPRTANPLFKRRPNTFSLLRATTTKTTTTTDAVTDTFTTTVTNDAFEVGESSDQVAKSSIYSSHFNKVHDRPTSIDDDEEVVDEKHLLNAANVMLATRAPQPAQQNKFNFDELANTRRMDETVNLPTTTTKTTTLKPTWKKRKMIIKRRPHKVTPNNPQPVITNRVNRRRPYKYLESFDKTESNQAVPAVKVGLKQTPKIYRSEYDYYDDEDVRVVDNSEQQLKVILHGGGVIECLDQGNFPHPLSCRKFISCAKFETGGVVGWEYTCPKGLSYDPVGGMCNWAAGLGCKE